MPAARLLRSLLCLPLLGAALPARADEPLHAVVLHVDGEDIVIDAGAEQLAGIEQLTLYRTLEVRHPLTGKRLRDRFPIGVLRIVQPGERLSIARVVAPPNHPVAVGDLVEQTPASVPAASPPPTVASAPAAAPPAPVVAPTPASAPAPTPSAPSAPPIAQPAAQPERAMLLYWYATLNQPPERRIRLYLGYLEQHPTSPYRTALQKEIAYLRAFEARLRLGAVASAPEVPSTPAAIEMLPLTAADAGRSLEFAALVRAPRVRAVLLHVRALEESGYRTLDMQVDARGHARARIGGDAVRAPGIAYFIEVVGEDGKAQPALGSASEPKIAAVRGVVPEPPRRERATRVRASSELVSFDGTSGRDYYFITEGDFLYRVRRGPLYGVRVGYGTLRGEGGTVEQLDVQMLDPEPAGFTYGFLEAELELHRLFGLAGRGTIGLGRPDEPSSQRNAITGGFQLRARIGEADGTRLVLAGEAMPEIGQRAYIGLAWEAIARLPMATEIVVTDQPVNSDELAVRMIYEIGYRFTDRVAVSLRPSYQLRTIRHAGPGIGMAATFDW